MGMMMNRREKESYKWNLFHRAMEKKLRVWASWERWDIDFMLVTSEEPAVSALRTVRHLSLGASSPNLR